MDESMCSVGEHAILFHEVQHFNGPAKFFIITKCYAKMWFPISFSGVAVAIGFSNWPFAD